MSRTARQASASGIYHIMLRGADRRIIFADDQDCDTFLRLLEKVREKTDSRLYAYCLMGNHVHLLMKEGKEPLEQFFKRLGVSYVRYYNQKYQLLGHLFQDRFRSEGIDTDAYYLDVMRYICQNPVKAGLVKSFWDYPYLGCGGILDKRGILNDAREYTRLDDDELRVFLEGPCQDEHLEDDGPKRLLDAEAIERLRKVSGCGTVQEIGGLPEKRRDEVLRQGMRAGISIRQLSRLTGISKALIERIKKGE